MPALSFEERLRRAELVLTKVAEGHLDQRIEMSGEDDALAGLEMGINLLVVDLRQTEQANREQREALLLEQRELQAKVVAAEQQAAALRERPAPVLPICEEVLLLPIVGEVDSRRSAALMSGLLEQIVAREARCVILDVTGVEVCDTRTVDDLLKLVRAARLLGARCVLTGLRAPIAQTLVEMGVDLGEVRTLRNLGAGLLDCLRFLETGREEA